MIWVVEVLDRGSVVKLVVGTTVLATGAGRWSFLLFLLSYFYEIVVDF